MSDGTRLGCSTLTMQKANKHHTENHTILVGFDPSPSRFSQGCSREQQVGLWARYGQNMLCSKQLHPLVVVLAM